MSHLWDLTTVSQHAYAQGVRAASALLGILGIDSEADAQSAPETDRLRVELIIRDSTASVSDPVT
jgi:DNA-binding LacI/PurR family transcriptional regulator